MFGCLLYNCLIFNPFKMHLLILPAGSVELSSDVLISIEVYWSVNQNTADKATNLFHVRQLCPLKYER